MDDPVTDRVKRLLEQESPVSRNRDFASFATPEGGRVWRAYKLYRSLLADLVRVGRSGVRVRPAADGKGAAVEVRGLPGHGRRTTWVPASILKALLRRLPVLRAAVPRDAGAKPRR